MKINEHTKLIGDNVILVPFKKCHVKKYHKWSQSEEILDMTGEDPITLEKEYERHEKWVADEGKCSFIVLDRAAYEFSNDEVEAMVGETKTYIIDKDVNCVIAEIEIMIAEESARRKKYGWEAVIITMLYGIKYLSLVSYEARMLKDNEKAIKLFEKLKFKKVSSYGSFEELVMEKVVTDEWVDWLTQQTEWQMQPNNKTFLF